MSAKVETSIWLALKSRISTLLTTYARAWPGQTFTPPTGGSPVLPLPYLSIGRVTASPLRELIADGKPHQRTGSLMITLVHPLGQPVEVYDQIAATIAEHFVDGTQVRYGSVCVTVTEYPHVQEGYSESGYWFVPVRIPWRCFV